MTSDKAVWVGERGKFFSSIIVCPPGEVAMNQQRLEKVCLVMPFLVFYKTYNTVLLKKLQQRGIREVFSKTEFPSMFSLSKCVSHRFKTVIANLFLYNQHRTIQP